MSNKAYYLSSCSTCKRILKDINLPENITLIDIKTSPLDEVTLEELKDKAGTYEALLNKRAQLYKQRDFKNKHLSEDNIKSLLLEHYTFLSRPVFLFKEKIFIGNSKKVIDSLKMYLNSLS